MEGWNKLDLAKIEMKTAVNILLETTGLAVHDLGR